MLCLSTCPRCQVNWWPTSSAPAPRTFIFVFRLTCTLCPSLRVYPNFEDYGSCFPFTTSLSFCRFTLTDAACTQLIRPSHTCSSGRMWPCLIVYHAYLFSLHDVTIAYLFSPGLLSHIKMIDSFHSLHIFKLYLISAYFLGILNPSFSPRLKVIMLLVHIAIHRQGCFFS